MRAQKGLNRAVIYFDHNATTPLHPAARTAWLDAADRFPANPSSPHRLGGRSEAALSGAREVLGSILGCPALDVVWTSGASESANMLFHHWSRSLPDRAVAWVSALEHPCVLAAADYWMGERCRRIPATSDGLVDLAWMEAEVARRPPAAVAAMAANNETGVEQPWVELSAWCASRGVAYACDAVQWLGKRPGRGLGSCDFVLGSAHKFGGPKGVGFLKCPREGSVMPLIQGGPQEDGRRAGTENVAGVAAMAAALQARETLLNKEGTVEREAWRAWFEQELVRRLPGTIVLAPRRSRLWNTVAALMPEADCRSRWVVKLDKLGFAVSTGSACASGKEAPSHVVTAMGLGPSDAARMLRFSAGWETTRQDWEQLLAALERVARRPGR